MRSLHPWPVFPTNLDPSTARSLSLQFILLEVVHSFELIEELRKSTPQKIHSLDLTQALHCITEEIKQFLLFSLENPFTQKGSVLDKLCFYSEILLQASQINGPDIPLILEEMRNSVLHTKSQLLHWKKMPTQHLVSSVLSHFLALYTDLHSKFRRFFTALTPFIYEAHSDENVWIFLLENKEKLNQHLGARTVEKVLSKCFPKGPMQLRAVIYEGYVRRGFEPFFIKQEALLSALQWEDVCPSPQKTH